MNMIRTARNLSAGTVAGIAGYASYWHQVAVALHAGERAELAHLIPLSVDGMLIVASIAMVDDRNRGATPRLSARIAFGIGIVASVAANVAAALPTIEGRIVAAWPAVALLLVVEILSRRGRTADVKPIDVAVTSVPGIAGQPEISVAAVLAEPSIAPVSPAPAGMRMATGALGLPTAKPLPPARTGDTGVEPALTTRAARTQNGDDHGRRPGPESRGTAATSSAPDSSS